jgi:hypothetical protein
MFALSRRSDTQTIDKQVENFANVAAGLFGRSRAPKGEACLRHSAQ